MILGPLRSTSVNYFLEWDAQHVYTEKQENLENWLVWRELKVQDCQYLILGSILI